MLIFAFHIQNNTFPERGLVYDFYFDKKATGSWIDWMDTMVKEDAMPPHMKVCWPMSIA